MAKVIRKQKGWSGFPTVTFRTLNGETYDSYVTSAAALGTPAAPTVTVVGTAGTTAYSYRITALSGSGETVAGTGGTTATGNATLTGVNFNRVTWAAVAGAVGYKVYGRTAGTELLMATILVTAPGGTTKVGGGVIDVNASGNGFEDTGAVTPAGALPGAGSAFTFSIRVPGLRQGPSGGTNWVKTTIPINTTRAQVGVIVQGR